MSLPTSTSLKTMDFSFLGRPFIDVPAKDSIATVTMDFALFGRPFVTNPAPAAAGGDTTSFFNFF